MFSLYLKNYSFYRYNENIMTISKDIINEIKTINDNKLNAYVYVPFNYCDEEEYIVRDIIDELFEDEYILKTLSIKNIETYNFTIEITGDNNYEYNVDLYDYIHLHSNDFYFKIERLKKNDLIL